MRKTRIQRQPVEFVSENYDNSLESIHQSNDRVSVLPKEQYYLRSIYPISQEYVHPGTYITTKLLNFSSREGNSLSPPYSLHRHHLEMQITPQKSSSMKPVLLHPKLSGNE